MAGMERKALILNGNPNSTQTLTTHMASLDGWGAPDILDHHDDLPRFLSRQMADLLFIDFDQHGSAPFSVLSALPSFPPIVLVSASPQAAIHALELGATDLLVTPISFPRFHKAVLKAEALSPASPALPLDKAPNRDLNQRGYFFVKADYKIVKVNVDDIQFIQGMREYVRIHTPTEKIVTLQSLAKFEEILPSERFVRIHRSYIVNIDKIHFIQGNIISIGDTQITISKRRRDEFLEMINTDGLF